MGRDCDAMSLYKVATLRNVILTRALHSNSGDILHWSFDSSSLELPMH